MSVIQHISLIISFALFKLGSLLGYHLGGQHVQVLGIAFLLLSPAKVTKSLESTSAAAKAAWS